jgi:hypothetical protein
MPPVLKWIDDFLKHGWKSDAIMQIPEIARSRPDIALEVVNSLLNQIPKGGTFLDATFTWLPEEEWSAAVSHALGMLRRNASNDAAGSVIAYASLQASHSLQPHLQSIFELAPNPGTCCENWPFRSAGTEDIEFLKATIETIDEDVRFKAWECLLETRHAAGLEAAIAYSSTLNLNHRMQKLRLPPTLTLTHYLHHVGFELIDGKLDRLYHEPALHLVFPNNYFEDARPVWISRDNHPTWFPTPASRQQFEFGGIGSTTCGCCGGTTHGLIRTNNAAVISPVTCLQRLSLETCLSCLGWEQPVMFYEHFDDGSVRCLSEPSQKPPEFPAGPLKPCVVSLHDQGARWRTQDWGLSNSRENLNRLGGMPCWVQSADYPSCPVCDHTMQFLIQLDSGLPTADGGEWLWGSGGIVYIFWCDACRVSGLHWQCT